MGRTQRYVRAAHSGDPATDYERAAFERFGLPLTAETLAVYRAGHVDGWDELADLLAALRDPNRPGATLHVTKRVRKKRSDAGVKRSSMVDNDAQSA